MRIVAIPLLPSMNKSFFSNQALVPITNVAEPMRLNQAATQRRRRVCCAQTWLDAEQGAALCIAYLPTCFVSVIHRLS